MREGGKILASILIEAASRVSVGLPTSEIEKSANRLCLKYKVRPAFLGYRTSGSKNAFPASICISVNDEIVHGLPGERVLKNGDIVSLDLGILYKGYITDAALTVSIGEIKEEDKRLIKVTQDSLSKGIGKIKSGARVGDISRAIQEHVEGRGLNVFKSLAGHGVGKELHEEPTIPNFGIAGTGDILKEGMTLAVEVMATSGKGELKIADDGWTMKTTDGKKAAQFEHTVLVARDGFEILTQSR